MDVKTRLERDLQQQQLGACAERVSQVERQLAKFTEKCEAGAKKWNRLLIHRNELGEWLIDSATNDRGELIKPQIDAGLGGEDFVPCTFIALANGKRYELSLSSTQYDVREI